MAKGNVAVLVVAIICLTTLEVMALVKGLDGYLFSLIAVAVAGIAGYKLPFIVEHLSKRKLPKK